MPIVKEDGDRGSNIELDKSAARQYRGIIARMNYLGQDRSQIQFAVKELSRGMARPTEKDRGRLKKLVRFLKGCPRYINHRCYQKAVSKMVVWTDTDFAGCKKGRKSTSAGMMLHGSHLIKSWSTNQATIALSSGEAEYYGMVKGASQAMGLKAIMDDLGVSLKGPIQINTDASAAIGIGSRLGLGKVRHIEVNQLWLQDKVYKGEITLKKIGTDENLADALTKPVSAEILSYHVEKSGAEVRRDRHRLAPEVAENNGGRDAGDESSEQERWLEPGAAEEEDHGNW